MKTKRFIFPVLASMIAIGAAFATAEKTKLATKPVLASFYVDSEDATSYHVTSVQDPECGAGGAQVCQITSTASPDANGRIRKDQASASAWKP